VAYGTEGSEQGGMAGHGDIVCVIPARGGSKRVPGKNIRPLAGLPLIAHSIRNAHASGCFSRVVVSTDDKEIAAIAREHGAQTPFMREAHLANDHAGTAEVIVDAVRRLGAEGDEAVCCLYPTAPLIRPSDLSQSLARFMEAGVYSMVSTAEYDFPPLRAFALGEDGHIAFNWPQYELTRSQDLPHLVHDAGCFYWLRTKPFLERQRLVGPDSISWPLPRLRAADIDTEEDLAFAETLLRFHAGKDGHGR